MTGTTASLQHVHLRSLGILDRVIPATDTPESPLPRIMSREVLCAARDLDAEQLARIMLRERLGCMPVLDDAGRPIGMVTKVELVSRLVAVDAGIPRGLAGCTASDIMHPMTIALDEHAGIAHAAALMSIEHVHHMLVVGQQDLLVGVLTSLDLVRFLARSERMID